MDAPREFDAVVIGAGPAGCMAALTLARRGVRTLVVDKASKGRWKVCGCCLGEVGQRVLREAGLGRVLERAAPVRSLQLAARGYSTTLPMTGFLSIARETLDPMLADAALQAGAHFMWNTSASASPSGEVALRNAGTIHARVVIDASGLRPKRENDTAPARRARIGLGWTGTQAACAPGELTIALARDGYLGRVALPDGRADFAAAVAPRFLRSHATPTEALRAIWAKGGLDPAQVPDARWRGTPPLRCRVIAQHGRILRVGDALGYVEPLTGEGMSWALLAASEVHEDAIACAEHGPGASAWPRRVTGILSGPRLRCRWVCDTARRTGLVSAMLRLNDLMPAAGAIVAASLAGSRGRGARHST